MLKKKKVPIKIGLLVPRTVSNRPTGNSRCVSCLNNSHAALIFPLFDWKIYCMPD